MAAVRAVLTALLFGLLSSGATAATPVLRLSTTTSTDNSGLLAYLLPYFEADTGIRVKVIAVGSGKALELARNGDVDAVLVHAREAEEKFVAAGYGTDRRPVMHNDFLLVGPPDDPAGVAAETDVLAAFTRIAKANVRFISRGDDSGTDQMEQAYWRQIGTRPAGRAYVSAGLGMGKVLAMAAELGAYTLTDRASYASYAGRQDLAVLLDGDSRMFNPYSVIAVSPERHQHVNYAAASAFIAWISSDQAKARIAAYEVAGQRLFVPSGYPFNRSRRPD
jgi:tungstate transport system substrate-binding protein